MEQRTVTLPACWVGALLRGDFRNVSAEQASECWAVAGRLAGEGWTFTGTIEGSERFTWNYRIYDPLADVDGGFIIDFQLKKV